MMRTGLRSPLAGGIETFLTEKRALGRRFQTEDKVFRLLDRYLFKQGIDKIDGITPAVLGTFLDSRPRRSARSYNELLGAVRRLLNWLVLHEVIPGSPLHAQPRRRTVQLRPFLFDRTMARRLLDAAAQLPDSPNACFRGEIYQMVFALLYGLGLRVGEAARLRRQDVDFDRELIFIRQTKFGKSRLVPFGPRLGGRLNQYIEERESRFGKLQPDHALFSFGKDPRRPLSPNKISWTFHKLVLDLDLKVPVGVAPPHLHCLRHSFAVSTLLRWYRAGIDPSERLLYLSTFLGHVSPASTAVYLTITHEIFQAAGQRFEQFVAPVLREARP